ncbi:glycoside hydrolase family 3 N-terminal domain-containing protein [Adhaeribacter terreus]|uniref:beta-N-acetylhexosaminidase n=1 Tax=Adhaeribacter terreus TaxID=529703 RepID=A0ABW0E8P1_9BACT
MRKLFQIIILLSLLGGVGSLMSFNTSEDNLLVVREKSWVDSVFMSLTPDQRLGQLFMVAAYSNKDENHYKKIDQLARDYNIGGLMFLQGTPYRQAVLTNRYQSQSRVPMLISMDAEWGLSMRLDSSMHYARQMTLGALDDERLIYLMGKEIALKMKRLGVHISFSPDVDVNVNPANPVIGNRSFGESKEQVAKRGVAYLKGLQDNGIIAVAKHFPGHGDTDTDSHLALPVITADLARLNEVELYPFRKTFEAGVMGVMVAHLYIPKIDSTANQASTLSKTLVTGLLKEKMGYEGLIFTDALNMKGVSSFYKPGELDVMALLAGNDVLLFSEDVPTAMVKIKEAIAAGKITQEELDLRVKKILKAKYFAGLNKYKPIVTKNLAAEIDKPVSTVVQQEIYERATTVVRNKSNLLPFRNLDTISFASVTIGITPDNQFTRTLDNYAPFTKLNVPDRFAPDSIFDKLYPKLQGSDIVVVSIHGMNNTPLKDFGIGEGTRNFIKRLQMNGAYKVVVTVMGNAYSLKQFDSSDWLVCGFEDNTVSQMVVPQILFGALPARGRIPVTASENVKMGAGVSTPAINRLRYATPEREGMDSNILKGIDNIALEAIAYAATPGCQVLVVKNGAVVFNKAYGHYTYDKAQQVTNYTLYDIASVTKVASTLQAIMYLKDQGKINLDERIGTYLPELRTTNKGGLIIRDILIHQAGLQPFLPFWKNTVDDSLKPEYYAREKSADFPHEVIPGVYATKTMEDSLWRWTIKSKLISKKQGALKYEYKYSDLGFFMLKKLAEKMLKQNLNEFMDQNFYAPLGLTTMTFNPLAKFPRERIAPTEQDKYFRNSLVWGNVHDQMAAMSGGVAGHAGLFSNANDLAVLMQMDLNNGNYGGKKYFKNQVVREFSKRQNKENRRGLGWDKMDPAGNGPTSDLAPPSTFGHSGFTGTCAWIDPANKVIYIFLSNRVHPDAENNKLVKYNIRTRIHDVVYKSIIPKS